MSNPVAIIIGVGPGLGAAIARRYGRAGYDVALVARGQESLTRIGESLQADGVTAGWTTVDITDAAAFARAVEGFGGHGGRIDALHFNPSAYTEKTGLELTPHELLADLDLGVASLLTAVQAARPFMSDGARITATGGGTADRPWPQAVSLGVQKAALRNLVSALDGTLKADGIRAASVSVNGTLAVGTAFDPERIAAAVYDVAQTPTAQWRTEVAYDGAQLGGA